MAEDFTSEYVIHLIFRAWIYMTYALVNIGCSAHLPKALSKICSGQQVDVSCVNATEPHVGAASTNQLSLIGKELAQLTDIISKLFTTNQPCSPADSLVDTIQIANNHDNCQDESDEDSEWDLDDPFAVPTQLVTACASLSQYRSQNIALDQPSGERNPSSHTCPLASPRATSCIDSQQSSWNQPGDQISPFQNCESPRGKTQVASTYPDQSLMNEQEQHITCPEGPICESAKSIIPQNILPTIQKIARPEIITMLWYHLRELRTVFAGLNVDRGHETTESQDVAEDAIPRLLSRYQLEYNALSFDRSYFPEFPRRIYLANIYTLYKQATIIRKQTPRQRKKQRTANGIRKARKSLNDIFSEFLLSELQTENSTRQSTKKRFENWMALGRVCAKFVDSFGAGIFLLMPQELSNETLRALTVRQEDAIITYLQHVHPNLKSDIQHLTGFLLQVIKEQQPPHMRLKLERMTEDDLASCKHISCNLNDLFEYDDDIDYALFLTDESNAISEHAYLP